MPIRSAVRSANLLNQKAHKADTAGTRPAN